MNQPAAAATPNDDLAAVIPEPKSLSIAGEDVTITQIKIGRLPHVLRAVQPLTHMLKQDGPFDLKAMFMLYADDCLTLLAALSGRERGWIDDLEIDDAIRLLAALLEINLDFFVQRVLPLLPDMLATMRDKTGELQAIAGRKASSPSSPTVTA